MLYILTSLMMFASCSDHIGVPKGDNPGGSWIVNAEDKPSGVTVDIGAEKKQIIRLGIDAERLWYFWPAQADKLAVMGVAEIKADYVRVAIDCAYEREEGVKKIEKYDNILAMMRAMKKASPGIKFFASPRPLHEAYSAEEVPLYFTGTGVPWTCHPAWVWINNEFRDGKVDYNRDKHARYYADYLNLMYENGFTIDYMDYFNEKQLVRAGGTGSPEEHAADMVYLKDEIRKQLNPGVPMPLFIATSAWNPQGGINFLAPLTAETASAFDIASVHNTDQTGSLEEFAAQARRLGKEAWNTELHAWTGVNAGEDIESSILLWDHLRAGFSGIDTWLFYGPGGGTPHAMLWSTWNGSSMTKTTKYHIFKKVVNTGNLGYYVDSTCSDDNVVTVAIRKNNTLLVCLYNPTESKITDVRIQLPQGQSIASDIDLTYWTPNTDSAGNSGVVGRGDSDNTATVTLQAASVTCCSFKVAE